MPIVLEKRKKDLRDAGAMPQSRRSTRRLLGESVLYLVLFSALLETYFSMTGIGQQEFLRPDSEFGVKHIPNKIVTWRMEGYSSEKMNSDGLRDTEHSFQKSPGVYRIALLGDSATEGLQVALKDTYGKDLERMLNSEASHQGPPTNPLVTHGVSFPKGEEPPLSSENSISRSFEVINFGCSSYSTGQQLEQYRQQVLKYNPDAVVLMYNRGDSLENTIKPGINFAAMEPRPYFYLDEQNSLCLDKSVLQANWEKLQPHPFLDFLRSHSRIYGVFSQAHLSLTLNDSRYRKLDAWLRSLPTFGSASGSVSNAKNLEAKSELSVNSEYENPSRRDARAPRIEQVIPSSPAKSAQGVPWANNCISSVPRQDPMKVTLALVHTLAAETRSHNQLFVLMMFPNTIGDPDVAQQQKQLKTLSDHDSFDFIDLLPPFQNANPEADFIQIHFSPKGHEHVASMLFDLFQKKLFTTQ